MTFKKTSVSTQAANNRSFENRSMIIYLCSHKFWEGLFDTVDLTFIRNLFLDGLVTDTDIVMSILVPRNVLFQKKNELVEKEENLRTYLQRYGAAINFIHLPGRSFKGIFAALTKIGHLSRNYHRRLLWANNYFNCFIAVMYKAFHPDVVIHFDMKGLVAEEEFHHSNSNLIARSIKYLTLKFLERLGVLKSDSIIVVSESFRKYLANKHHCNTDRIELIPCRYDTKLFFPDKKLRDIYRSKLQVAPNQKLVLYSGMFQKWQGPDLIFGFLKHIQSQDMKHEFRFMILSLDLETAERLAVRYQIDDVILQSATVDQLNGFYNAADIGIAFRSEDQVSFVSSPVKIPEYLATGNAVILMEYIGDFGRDLRDKKYALVKKNKIELMNTTIYEVKDLHKPDPNDLVEIQEKYSYHSNIAALKRILDRFYAL